MAEESVFLYIYVHICMHAYLSSQFADYLTLVLRSEKKNQQHTCSIVYNMFFMYACVHTLNSIQKSVCR